MSTVLVVDDDHDIVAFLREHLTQEGFQVQVALRGQEALAAVNTAPPDLMLLASALADIDGYEVCRRVRHAPQGGSLPVIMLTSAEAGAARVLAFSAGADDCVPKPFDPLELVARMRVTLRRSAEMRAVSPLTGLPGNTRIETELAHRIPGDGRFAICYVDLDNFKAFNDRYGFLRGDEMISVLATALKVAAEEAGEPRPFVGHVGGDDFVAVCEPAQADGFCARLIELFDASAPALYDPEDAARGGVEVVDRLGQPQMFPLVSVSVGVVSSEQRSFGDYREAVAVATEMKAVAKKAAGSAVAVDRRRTPGDSERPPA